VIRQVNIGELVVSASPEDTLVAHSLGSCVGLALYDTRLHLAGLAHCMLPLSGQNGQRAQEKPVLFTDTGVAMLLQQMFDAGARRRTLVARAAGASTMLDGNGIFRIGEKNAAVLRRVLWKNSIALVGADFGGTMSRTLRIHVASGLVFLRSGADEWRL
jgi:chemotaxis protein CheD